MASVLGTSPVAITSKDGAHVTIPLSALTSNADGSTTITGWPLLGGPQDNSDDKKAAQNWVDYLFAQDELKAATAPTIAPPGDAFLLESVHPGDLGNHAITLKITNSNAAPVVPASATSFALEVTVENTYTGLTLNTLADTIGTAVDQGSKPGLIHLAAIPAPPPTQMPDNAQTVSFVPAGAVMQAKVKGGGGTTDAFTLEAPGDGGGASLFNVLVTVTSATKFDLKVTWKKTNTGAAAAQATAFAYVLKITKPPSGDFGAPPSGTTTVTLAGGNDPGTTPVVPKPAKATIPSA